MTYLIKRVLNKELYIDYIALAIIPSWAVFYGYCEHEAGGVTDAKLEASLPFTHAQARAPGPHGMGIGNQ